MSQSPKNANRVNKLIRRCSKSAYVPDTRYIVCGPKNRTVNEVSTPVTKLRDKFHETLKSHAGNHAEPAHEDCTWTHLNILVHAALDRLAEEYPPDPKDCKLRELKDKVSKLKEEVSRLKTAEIKAQNMMEELDKASLVQAEMITALQAVVMELCDKSNSFGGSTA
ncbi:hypothetical protein MMC07_003113 [Pseudocyphellaria aurata]|nr:hypothetical protein [Pseudocyphellaria aurata]